MMTSRNPDAQPTSDSPARPERSPEEDISLLSLASVVLRHRWTVVGAPIVLAVLFVTHGFLFTPRSWTSTGSFTPQTGQEGGGRLSGLASQVGIQLPSGEGAAQSPRFYADLLHSRELLAPLVYVEYSVKNASQSLAKDGSSTASTERMQADASQDNDPGRAGVTLIDAFGIQAEDSASATAAAVGKLKSNISVSTDRETGVVNFSVTMPSPELAHAVAGRLLDALHRFNVETRRSRASAKRQFLEERVRKARQDLRAAEDSLEAFLENNRQYENSPALVFERQRLQRRVDLQQQIYTSLSQSLEEARIDEVRNTPVVTVVEEPDRPVRPDGKGLTTRGFLGLLVGAMVGLFWAFGAEYVAGVREEEPDEYRTLSTLLKDARSDLARLGQRARSLFAGSGDGD